MSINPAQLREYVVRPVLKSLGLYSEAAEELLMLTAATESLCGEHLHQVKGPAMGVWQMEPATHNDIHGNYLKYRNELAGKVAKYGSVPTHMVGNLNYACAMARVHYLRVAEPLPAASDVRALASYWKKYYNTVAGAGTVEHAIQNYRKYAGGRW